MNLRLISTILISLLFSQLTLAYEDQTPEDQKDLYNIEIIVFKYNDLEGTNTELWKPTRPFAFSDALEIDMKPEKNPVEYIDDAELPEPTLPSVKSIAPNKFVLKREERQIANNNKYTLLLHTAWQQKLTDIYSTKPIHIRGGSLFDLNGKDIDEVDGTLTISKGKFIRIKTNLYLTEPSYEIAQIPNGLLSYPIRSTRNTKDSELNYIDNPVFGMLIKVTPFEGSSRTS